MRWKNSKGIEGCVFAMLIVYLHETHFGEYSEDDEARPPWISYWRGDRLKERLKLEKKDSTGLLSQAKQRKERMKKKKTTDPKRVETSTKIGKKGILNSKLAKSIEMEDTTKEKRTLGKRKHPEEAESEDISSDSESEPDSERTISQDDNTRLVVETNVEKGDIAEKESVIEVVEATSAEEELIKRELSESIANLVVETNVEKSDIAEKEEPKENVETDKEVQEEINRNIMMIAKMVVAQGDMGPLPSFDLGIDFGSQSQSQSQPEKEKEPAQETEKHDQDVPKQKGKEI
ncbi:hypothetical protein PIB30_098215 [Stylosanthes scabra]|uniref:Uncharacterized protein n=1 Tax=Stylosanthes scabra TaxID=79078 RepID=A0ABU6VWU3_9FABA|nr:hypothetical protein [Stylosanthes scabra]